MDDHTLKTLNKLLTKLFGQKTIFGDEIVCVRKIVNISCKLICSGGWAEKGGVLEERKTKNFLMDSLAVHFL